MSGTIIRRALFFLYCIEMPCPQNTISPLKEETAHDPGRRLAGTCRISVSMKAPLTEQRLMSTHIETLKPFVQYNVLEMVS